MMHAMDERDQRLVSHLTAWASGEAALLVREVQHSALACFRVVKADGSAYLAEHRMISGGRCVSAEDAARDFVDAFLCVLRALEGDPKGLTLIWRLPLELQVTGEVRRSWGYFARFTLVQLDDGDILCS